MNTSATLTAVLVSFCACHVSADTLAENQARFGQVDGTVQLLSQGSLQWVDAHIDLPLESGDEIRVDEDGHAEISIAKNVLLFLDSGSDVIVGHVTTQEGHLTLTQGVLLGKIETAGVRGSWEFETPLGVCGVRGTEFAIVYSETEGMHLGVLKGQVDLSPAETAEGRQPAVVIAAHQEGVLQKKKPLKTLKTFSPVVQAHVPHVAMLQKRFHEVSHVWVPLTPDYRQVLRRKFVAPIPSNKTRPHRVAPRRTRHS